MLDDPGKNLQNKSDRFNARKNSNGWKRSANKTDRDIARLARLNDFHYIIMSVKLLEDKDENTVQKPIGKKRNNVGNS